MKRKWLALLLALILLLTAVACSSTASPKENYYFVLYNSSYLTKEDQNALDCLLGLYPTHDVFALDVANCNTAQEVYTRLRQEKEMKSGKLDGIQIIGTVGAVPSFAVDYKVTLPEGYTEGNAFFSDYFYTNLTHDASLFSAFNVADFLADGNSFPLPMQPVIRLSLGSGELSDYVANYRTYFEDYNFVTPIVTAISSPIFRYSSTASVDDLAYFLTRAKNEWGIIDDLRIYTNQEGSYLSPVPSLGDIGKESLASENEADVREFFFSGHGNSLSLYRTVFSEDGKENQTPFLTYYDLSSTLDDAPYFINIHACSTAERLSENLVREALRGKCLGAFAATSVISNNGIDSCASLASITSTPNFFGFHHAYLAAKSEGASRSHAFFSAQSAFAKTLSQCASEGLDYSASYEFGYHNLLTYMNFGIFEPTARRFPNEGTNGTENTAIPAETIFLNPTSGTATGDKVSLSAKEMMNHGANASVNDVSATVLDNGHIRFFVEIEAEGLLTPSLAIIGNYTLYCSEVPLPSKSYVIVIDIFKDTLFRDGIVAFHFKCGGESNLWGIDDFSVLSMS